MRPFLLPLLACAWLAGLPPAAAETSWMSEEAMRAEFVGGKMKGYYRDGTTWAASYPEGGHYPFCVGERCGKGRWYLRGRAFCFVVRQPPWLPVDACVAVNKISANCYEFHRMIPTSIDLLPGEGDFLPEPRWHSRGWRQSEPSTAR
jgi:hypothetical protein